MCNSESGNAIPMIHLALFKLSLFCHSINLLGCGGFGSVPLMIPHKILLIECSLSMNESCIHWTFLDEFPFWDNKKNNKWKIDLNINDCSWRNRVLLSSVAYLKVKTLQIRHADTGYYGKFCLVAWI